MTEEEKLIDDLKKDNRKLAVMQTLLLRQKTKITRGKLNGAIIDKVKAKYTEGEQLRKAMALHAARGQEEMKKRELKSALKTFEKCYKESYDISVKAKGFENKK